MSRLGKKPVELPSGVEATISGNVFTVKGPKGEASQEFSADVTVKVEDNKVVLEGESATRQNKANHGLYRAFSLIW